MSPYQALTLDMFGTVFDSGIGVLQDLSGRLVRELDLKVSPSEFFERWEGRFFSLVTPAASFRTIDAANEESLRMTLTDYGAVGRDPSSWLQETRTRWEQLEPFPEVREFLRAMEGFPICLLTNADDWLVEHLLRAHALTFDHVITSESRRLYKPDRRLFVDALEALGAPAGSTVHAGDSLRSDIDGARTAGMVTCWVNRSPRGRPPGELPPDFEVSNLEELARLLRPDPE